MVTVHAAIIAKPEPDRRRNRGWAPGRWAAVCGSHGMPISDQVERVTCEACKRIMKERGIVL